jgi:hypothetical protein
LSEALCIDINENNTAGCGASGTRGEQGVIYLKVERRQQEGLEQKKEDHNTGQTDSAEENERIFPVLSDPRGRGK